MATTQDILEKEQKKNKFRIVMSIILFIAIIPAFLYMRNFIYNPSANIILKNKMTYEQYIPKTENEDLLKQRILKLAETMLTYTSTYSFCVGLMVGMVFLFLSIFFFQGWFIHGKYLEILKDSNKS